MSSDVATGVAVQRHGKTAWLVAGALLVGLMGLGMLFGAEVRAALRVWNDSTAYGHCYFVIPIAVFLAWERRQAASATPVRPWPMASLLALPLGIVWLAVERLGIMEGQQFIAIGSVELLFVAVLGWRMCRVLAVPLLYLGFLVPFGAFATPALQQITAGFVTHGLDMLGIANYSDGFTIEIPEGTFLVAEACAGLRFLIASIAFGVLYACVIYRSTPRRLAFVAASVVVPILANGFRALGIVVLGHLLGSAEAATVDHILYGWVFFSLVIVALILLGLPFREDHRPPKAITDVAASDVGRPRPGMVMLATAAVLVLTAIAPAIAGWLDLRAAAVPLAMTVPGPLAGCQPPEAGATEGRMSWVYQCALGLQPPERLTLTLSVVSPGANPGILVRIRHAVTGDLGADDVDTRPLRGDEGPWQLVTTLDPDRLVGIATWIDGRPATGGFAQRRRLAWASVAGAEAASVMVTIATPAAVTHMTAAAQQAARAGITALIERNPDLPDTVAAFSRTVVRPDSR